MNTTEQFECVLKLARQAAAYAPTKEVRAVEKFALRVHRMRQKLDDLRARNEERRLRLLAEGPPASKVSSTYGRMGLYVLPKE
jgi:hypothetical protein